MPKTCADTVISSSGRYCIVSFGCRQTRHRTIWVPSECSSIPLVRCETEAQPDEMPFLACEAWMSQKTFLCSPVCWKQCPTLSYNHPTMSLAKDVGCATEQKYVVLFTSEPLFTTSPPNLKMASLPCSIIICVKQYKSIQPFCAEPSDRRGPRLPLLCALVSLQNWACALCWNNSETQLLYYLQCLTPLLLVVFPKSE